MINQRTIVPAQPGWFVINGILDADGTCGSFLSERVIAWVIISRNTPDPHAHYHEAMAITVDGTNENDPQILQRPDGTFVAPYVRQLDRLSDVIGYLNELAPRRGTNEMMASNRDEAKPRIINMHGRRGQVPPGAVYVGDAVRWVGLKASKWANPFKRRHGTLEERIEKYCWHLLNRPDLVGALSELRGMVLACWCYPERCHAEVALECST